MSNGMRSVIVSIPVIVWSIYCILTTDFDFEI